MTDDADRTGWAVLVAASAGALLCFLNLSALNVALPAAARSLHASPAQASWILLSYMLVSTVCILSFGRLADLWGRRRLFLSGLSLFIAACAACAFAPNAELMLAARVCQAVSAAGGPGYAERAEGSRASHGPPCIRQRPAEPLRPNVR